MRITFLLVDVDGGGRTARSVVAQANSLADLGQEVTIVSALGATGTTGASVDPRVTVHRLVDVHDRDRPGPADPTLASGDLAAQLHAAPSALVPSRWDRRCSALTDAAFVRTLPTLAADVVVTATPALLAIAAQLLPPGPALVHQEHGVPSDRSGATEALLAFAPRADLVALLADTTQQWLTDALGRRAPRTAVLPHPLPLGFRPSSTLETGLVVAAGRFVSETQMPRLVAAFAQAAEDAPGWRLRLIGAGPQRPELVRAARRRRLYDRLELPGESADMASEWAMASIAAVPSRADGSGLDVQEAMAAGVPVVAYDVPTAPRALIRHDVDGLLVSPGSVAGMAAALSRLMCDPAVRHRLGRAAVRSAAAATPASAGRRWLEVYDEAVGRHRAGIRRPLEQVTAAGDAPAADAGTTVGPADGPAVGGPWAASDVTPAEARSVALRWATRCAAACSTRWFVMPAHAERAVTVVVPMEDRSAFLTALGGPDAPELLSLVDTAGHGWPAMRDTLGGLAPRLAAYRTGRVGLEPWPTLADGTAGVLSSGCRVDVEFWERAPGGDLVAAERNPWTDRIPSDPDGGTALVEVEMEGVRVRTLPLMSEPTVLDCRFPVDIVYTWVDGDDPVWQAARARAADGGDAFVEQAEARSRYTSRDELRYSMRSVHLFAPWVRTIHLVTAGQVPGWLREHPQVRVVDHRQILPREALPTFNSHAIETALHRVPGLAEHFVYLNDDVLLGRPQRPERFFSGSGQPAVFFADRSVGPDPDRNGAGGGGGTGAGVRGSGGAAGPWASAGWNNRRLLREAFGVVNTVNLAHAAHPHRVSVLAEIERRFPEEIGRTARSPFRSEQDVSLLSSLAQHYGLATGAAVVGSAETALVDLRAANIARRLRHLLGRQQDFICLADSSDHALTPGALRDLVVRWGEAYLPVPAPWEKA